MADISQTTALNAEQLALVLDISEWTVRRLAKTGQLPCIYLKRRLAFDFTEVFKRLKKLEDAV